MGKKILLEDKVIALHEEAMGYNWDGGVERLFEIIRDPDCDLGTAKLVYWNGYDRKVFDLLKEIEKRVADKFYKIGLITYDPFEDHEINMEDVNVKKIPEIMFEAVEGRFFI